MQRCASLARVMWHSAVILPLPWCVVLVARLSGCVVFFL